MAHLVDLRAGRGLAVGLDDEPDALAHRDLRHVRVAERRERPLDRRALRVEDAGQVRDIDPSLVARHQLPLRSSVRDYPPYQSAKDWPVSRSYAST